MKECGFPGGRTPPARVILPAMIYGFENFALDTLKIELFREGEAVPLEPQVFALLSLLIENCDRVVTKDEIFEKIWEGRFVSDSALASRIKSLRAALGDDGKRQKIIRTLHGQGFRFVAEPRVIFKAPASSAASPLQPSAQGSPSPSARPSIAILPFRLIGAAGDHAGVVDALPDELISVLSRLRWLLVIARGTAFRFRPPNQDAIEIGAALGVRYCLTGAAEIVGDQIAVTVELAETTAGGVVWAERFSGRIAAIHEIRERIVSSIVAALELHIPLNEANAARLKSPDRIDAWSAYHLGLQHLYRFNTADNAVAVAMFGKAVTCEPDFARAHAGLSSAHFQNAFLRYSSNRDADTLAARRHAERSVELDPLDPFTNFAMGRVHWIENDISGGAGWLDRSVLLSPNYAQGIYARAWANAITGEGVAPAQDIDLALTLSPLDPFRYGMLGVRAFACLADGDETAAAHWAEQAARAPGAHVLIAAIAMAMHAINGDTAHAERWAANVRSRRPTLSQAEFFEAFPFSRPALRARLANALQHYGF